MHACMYVCMYVLGRAVSHIWTSYAKNVHFVMIGTK